LLLKKISDDREKNEYYFLLGTGQVGNYYPLALPGEPLPRSQFFSIPTPTPKAALSSAGDENGTSWYAIRRLKKEE
jgi:hypothetical protein